MTALRDLRWVLLAAAAGYAAAAEIYPAKPVRVIAAFSPGGFVDLTARLVSVPLSAALGQQVVVENRAGAGGIVGTELVARAAPDGYTLTVGSAGTHGVNQSLYPKLSYHVLRDFQPVARLADAPSILAVHPSLPVRSVKELIALARVRRPPLMDLSAMEVAEISRFVGQELHWRAGALFDPLRFTLRWRRFALQILTYLGCRHPDRCDRLPQLLFCAAIFPAPILYFPRFVDVYLAAVDRRVVFWII